MGRRNKNLEPYLCYTVLTVSKGKWEAHVINLDDTSATGSSKAEVMKKVMAIAQSYCDDLADEGILPPRGKHGRVPHGCDEKMQLGFFVYVDRARTIQGFESRMAALAAS